jgi:hypothetical protein
MRIPAPNVKQLAPIICIWHRFRMTDAKQPKANAKPDPKTERLAAALRANLRLRKAQARTMDGETLSVASEQPKK